MNDKIARSNGMDPHDMHHTVDFSKIDGLNPNQREYIRAGIEGTERFNHLSQQLPLNELVTAVKTVQNSGISASDLVKHLEVQHRREVVQSRVQRRTIAR